MWHCSLFLCKQEENFGLDKQKDAGREWREIQEDENGDTMEEKRGRGALEVIE